MIFGSLNELYKNKNFETPKNNYDYIIKNLLNSDNRSNKNIPDPSMSNKSKYTTYKEIENFENKYNIDKIDEIVDKIENTEKKDEIKINMNTDNSCLEFLDHISKCEKCRNFILKKMNLKSKTEEDMLKENMLDITIYILSGIFILFLLNSFINLGKMLKK